MAPEKIAFLGWHHPAESTFSILAERGWVSVLVVPDLHDFRSTNMLDIAKRYDVPVTADIEELVGYQYSVLICSNYPYIVPRKYFQDVLALNCHWSLLPAYRGMHPTAWALINGEERIGQSIHIMEDDVDSGDIVQQDSILVEDHMDIRDIFREMSRLEATGILGVMEEYFRSGEIEKTAQQENRATYVPRRTPEMGQINWCWPARRIWNLTRALPPELYPPAYTWFKKKKVLIHRARLVQCPNYYCPEGTVVRVGEGFIWVKAQDSVVEINEACFEEGKTSDNVVQQFKFGDVLGD